MEWPERMNSAIEYIEDRLEEEIDFNQAAKKACCSPFHFQRVFFVVNGITPAEYVRRRRLTLAARDLSSGNEKIIDIALKYGYDSPDAFTRAFRRVHGITPQAAREPGVKLVAFPRVSFQIVLKGGIDMDYRIIEKPAFEIAGRSRKFFTVNGENFINIPRFWQEYMATTEYQTLCSLSDGKPGKVTGAGCLGVCLANEENGWDPFIYAIAIEKTGNIQTTAFEVFTIPAATWAVFDCTIPTIQDVTKRIFSEWFPSTGYEHDAKPEIEVYLPDDPGVQEHRCQVWIPVVKHHKQHS
jgi:AraC family transcriptional regulator